MSITSPHCCEFGLAAKEGPVSEAEQQRFDHAGQHLEDLGALKDAEVDVDKALARCK